MKSNHVIVSAVLFSIIIAPTVGFAQELATPTAVNGAPLETGVSSERERERENERHDQSKGKFKNIFKRTESLNFCTSLDAREQKKDIQFNEQMNQLNARRDDHAEKLVSMRSDRDMKRGEKRDDWDTKRETKFKDWEVKATTTEGQAALSVYKISVENAVTARKTAIDAAITEFRTGMDALNAGRATVVDAAKTALNQIRTDAIAKAKADCAAGIDPKTAEATFRATLDAGRAQYPAPKRLDKNPELKSAVDALVLKRKTAVDTAQKTFKAAIDAARAELIKVIPAPVKK